MADGPGPPTCSRPGPKGRLAVSLRPMVVVLAMRPLGAGPTTSRRSRPNSETASYGRGSDAGWEFCSYRCASSASSSISAVSSAASS